MTEAASESVGTVRARSCLVSVNVDPFSAYGDGFRHSLLLIPVFIVGSIAFGVILTSLGPVSTLLQQQPGFQGILVSVLIISAFGFLNRVKKKGVRRFAKRIVAEGAGHDIETLTVDAWQRRPKGTLYMLFHELAREMAIAGRTGAAIRIGRAANQSAITGIDLPFEPRPLDEADRSFLDLAQAMSSKGLIPSTADDESSDNSDRDTRLRIRRNVKFGGGYWVVGFMVLMVVVQAMRSYSMGRVTLESGMVFFGFFIMLLGGQSIWGGLPGPYVVPSGIIMPVNPVKGKAKKRLRLFSRDRSVVFIVPRVRGVFELVVSDGEDVGVRQVTLRETNVLLCGWMGSVGPPEEEMVVNMVFQNRKEKSQS